MATPPACTGRVVITGGTGFVGRAAVTAFAGRGNPVTAPGPARMLPAGRRGAVHPGPELAAVLRGYQLTVGYTPGPLLGLALVAGLLGGFGVGNARRSRIRAASLLVSGLGITVLMTAAAFEFSWRYQLPGLVLLPLAGALGITACTGPLRRPGPRPKLNPPMQPYPDPVDTVTVAEFTRSAGEVRFAPVVVVIAAYDEADGIGAWVCEATANRGQGAALRLGYGLARRGGARYVVTTDADGQYDMDELPLLLSR